MEENIVWENEWANFMSMDRNGRWWEYSHTPLKRDLCWDSYLNTKADLKKVVPSHKPYWEKSLIKRKEENNMKDNIIFVWEYEDSEYMAMDNDGAWFEYTKKPSISHKKGAWFGDSFFKHREKEINPTHIVNWEESLIERQRNIKTIRLYETSDNSVFRDLKEAEEHQKKVDLDELLFKNGYSKEDAMTFSNFIIENKDKLKEILFNRKD